MKIHLKETTSVPQAQCLVSWVTHSPSQKNKKNILCTQGLGKDSLRLLSSAHKEGSFLGKKKEICLFREAHLKRGRHWLVLGLGEAKKVTPETLRQSMASALTYIKKHNFQDTHINLDEAHKMVDYIEDIVSPITEGLVLGNYSFDTYKSTNPEKKQKASTSITLLSQKVSSTIKTSLKNAKTLSEAVNFSRTLGDTPGHLMTPTLLAQATQKAAQGTALKVTVWDKARIQKEKMGGLYGVSLGSGVDPCFIFMEYKGTKASKKPICFVGKGLTFDSGGISLKPGRDMDQMKYDLCGGANVIATMVAIARLKLKVNAIACVPASENMPGPMAVKPGDVLTARNGKTVEVLNTDAEGRLILMDALSYACEKKPAAIIDAATLTGSIVVALGNVYSGVFTRNDALLKKIFDASIQTEEKIWHLPICDEFVEDMKGHHADLANISSRDTGAGSSTAAAFLEQFVDKDIPWAHFDIAGTAWRSHRISYNPPKGASGCLVRTFVELAKSF